VRLALFSAVSKAFAGSQQRFADSLAFRLAVTNAAISAAATALTHPETEIIREIRRLRGELSR